MLKFKIIPVTDYEQNCSLIWCDQTHQAVLIDPGGDVPILWSAIKDNNLDLKQIWLTHGHFDHISGSEEISSSCHIEIIGPQQDDLFLLNALAEQCEIFNFPKVKNFVSDQWLSETDTLKLCNEQFEIFHTPGHTPGHIVIIHHASKTVWVGDVLFKQSIGRTDLPGGNHAQLIASIKNKLFTLPDDYQFIPGHGPSGFLGEEKQHNPFLQG